MRLLGGPQEGARAVVVTHLQMLSADDMRPAMDISDASLIRIETDKATWSRWYYDNVGGPWKWVDRANWDDSAWQAWTDRPTHHLYEMTIGDAQVGYVELEQQGDGAVEIAYLGLLPGHAGAGRGGWLLTSALRRAWALPSTGRVWVHTCDLDAPAAVHNYRARGMREFARVIEWRDPSSDTVGS